MEKERKLYYLAISVYVVNCAAFLLSFLVLEMDRARMLLFILCVGYAVYVDGEIPEKGSTLWNSAASCTVYSGWRRWLYHISRMIAVLSFVSGLCILWEGNGRVVDGELWLALKSDLIRPITDQEYRTLIGAENRMWIGFMFFLTAKPLAYFGEKMSVKSVTS